MYEVECLTNYEEVVEDDEQVSSLGCDPMWGACHPDE